MKIKIRSKKQAQQMWNVINMINGISIHKLANLKMIENSKAVDQWLKESEREFLDMEDIKRQLEKYMDKEGSEGDSEDDKEDKE